MAQFLVLVHGWTAKGISTVLTIESAGKQNLTKLFKFLIPLIKKARRMTHIVANDHLCINNALHFNDWMRFCMN